MTYRVPARPADAWDTAGFALAVTAWCAAFFAPLWIDYVL